MALTNKLSAIGDAIRSKTGKTGKLSLSQMPNEILSIQTGSGGSSGTPIESIFNAEMVDTVSKVNALTNGKNCYVMVLIADTHAKSGSTGLKVFTESTMPNVKRLCEQVHVDAVVHLGDLIDGSETKATSIQRIKDLRGLMMKCGSKWRIHDGNHDHNGFQGTETGSSATSEFISTSEMANMLAQQVDTVSYSRSLMYFYEDIEALNLRVIYASSNYNDNVGGGYGTAWGYPTTEINWIRDTALNTDKNVLFCSHMGLIGEDSQYGIQPNKGTDLKAVIDSFCQNGGKVIGWFNGHNHWDRIKEYDNFKAVSVNCNGVWNVSHTSDIPSTVTDAKRWARSLSDYTKDCFDVAIINMDDSVVNFVRFGAGDDREYSFTNAYIPIKFTSTLNDVTASDGDEVNISLTANRIPTSVKWEAYLGTWVDMGLNSLDIIIPVSMQYNGAKLRCTISDGTSTATTREAILTVTEKEPETSYTNVIKTVGYTDGQYMSGNATGADVNYTATGYIPFKPTDTLYIKGNPGWAEESHCRMTAFNASQVAIQQLHSYSTIKQYFTFESLGTNYVRITPKTSGSYILNAETAFVRMSLKGKGADLIVTVNEPIVD